MEQVIVIIALVVYWIFRGAARSQSRLPRGDTGDGPVTRGGLDDEIKASQQRALEALQRWEARQRAEARKAEGREEAQAGEWAATRSAVKGPPRVRVEAPAELDRPPRVHIATRRAEQQRGEAYADIARMLDPAARQGPGAARRGSLRVRTSREAGLRRRVSREPAVAIPEDGLALQESAFGKWAEGADREARDLEPPESKERAGLRQAIGGRRGPGTAAGTSVTPAPSAGPQRRAGVQPGAVLRRLERLPLPARAIAYAEILGPPPGLR